MNYAGLSGLASRLITSAGAIATFTRQDSMGFDPALGVESIEEIEFTANAVKVAYTVREIDGTLIKAGDCRLIVEVVTNAPQVGDAVTFGGVVYRVMAVESIEPGGVTVIYKLQVRA